MWLPQPPPKIAVGQLRGVVPGSAAVNAASTVAELTPWAGADHRRQPGRARCDLQTEDRSSPTSEPAWLHTTRSVRRSSQHEVQTDNRKSFNLPAKPSATLRISAPGSAPARRRQFSSAHRRPEQKIWVQAVPDLPSPKQQTSSEYASCGCCASRRYGTRSRCLSLMLVLGDRGRKINKLP